MAACLVVDLFTLVLDLISLVLASAKLLVVVVDKWIVLYCCYLLPLAYPAW